MMSDNVETQQAADETTQEVTTNLLKSLSEEQSLKLTFFKDLSQMDEDSVCVSILESTNWNLDAACQMISEDPSSAPTTPPPVSTPVSRAATPVGPSSSTTGGLRQRRQISSERVVMRPRVQPNPNGEGEGNSFLYQLLVSPIKFVYSTTISVFQFLWQLIYSVDPRMEQVTDPVGDVRKFIEDFKKDHPEDATIPSFIENTFDEATKMAKRDLKFLLVFTHNPGIPASVQFCEVLRDPHLITYINSNMLIWGCSTTFPEGNKTMRRLTRGSIDNMPHIGAVKPLSVVLIPVRGQIKIVHKFTERSPELSDPERFGERLRYIETSNSWHFQEAIRQREKLQADRNIRMEQERDYARALEMDKEKSRIQSEKLAEKEKAEQMKKLRKETKENRKVAHEERKAICLSKIQEEPTSGDNDVIKLRIKLMSGKCINRNFLSTDQIDVLHDFVYAQSCSPRSLKILKTFPRQPILGCSTELIDEKLQNTDESLPTLKEATLVGMETLCVESAVDDDSSSEESSDDSDSKS